MASTSYAAVSAVAVLLAMTAHGQTARKAELNDGGVWVTSGADHAFGRYLRSIGQLDAEVFPPSAQATDLDVLQDGPTVLAWDRSSSKLYGVDVSARELVGEGAVVPASTRLRLDGGTIAALDDKGALRATRVGGGVPDPAAVAAGPLLVDKLGPLSQLAVAVDGSVAVTTADRLMVFRVAGAGFATAGSTSLPDAGGGYQVSFIGGVPVVLDPATGQLTAVEGGKASPVATGLGKGVQLQQPGPAATTAAVAADQGLTLVPLAGGQAQRVSEAGGGPAAAPVRVGRCVFSAWRDGAYARSCGGAAAPQVPGYPPTGSTPVFRTNRGVVVLNDSVSGAVFEVDDTVRAADQLWQRVERRTDAAQKASDKTPLKHDGDNRKPEATDDAYGARPGRATALHVLDNDTDPEGDLLIVSAVDVLDGAGTTAVPSPDGQTVLATLPGGLAGPAHLRYTVDDGNGGQAQATVTLTPRSSSDNTPPQLREGYEPPVLALAPSGTVRLPVLSDWRDADGDPLLVTDPSPPGAVVPTNDGALLITAPAQKGPFPVGYSVTDALSKPVPAPALQVTVLDPAGPAPFAPPIARPDSVRVTVGQPAVLTPLANDLPGADATDPQAHLSLGAPVAAQDGLQVSTDVLRGTVAVTTSRPGTFHLGYVAAFGHGPTALGEIRVESVPAEGASGAPVAVPDAAVLRGQRPVVVDVLANDYDPAGGLLVVQDATGDERSGVSATVIDGRSVRLVATGAGSETSGSVAYRMSNGRGAPVAGSVAVTVLPATTDNAAPFALDDSVVVRAGDSAAVPVLDNDFDPDGDPVTLLPAAVPVDPAVEGVSASISGRTVRVAAPATITAPRQVSLEYVAVDPSGARARGRVSVSIVPAGPADQDQPPTPRDLEGRLVAGDTFLVRVPVYGVDPDGDSVTVTAVVQPPSLGRVTGIGPDSITYQAYPDSGGTDSMTYEVVDAQGRTGRATVRLAVVAPGALSPPVAVDDNVSAVPGRTVHLDVTSNDLVSAGGRLEVLPLDRFGAVPAGVSLDGSVVSVPVPPEKGAPTVVPYAITDGSGAPSVANVTVRGDAGALLPPLAQDDSPTVDASSASSVTVDVLKNDDDPDGSSADLKVSTFAADAQVQEAKVVVPVTDQPRQVAYLVTDPDGLTAMAVVRVPGKASQLPKVKPGARVRVDVGGTVAVPLTDLVEDPAGKPVKLTTNDKLFSSPAQGVSLSATDAGSLLVAGAGTYAGPGAVSFEVTDEKDLQSGRAVQLTVPVQVGPDAPALRCPATPLQAVQGGADVVVDLLSVCHVWVDTTVKPQPVRIQAAFTQPLPGVTAAVRDAATLVLTAENAAKPGSTGAILLTVPGTSATGELAVEVLKAPKMTVRSAALAGLQADVPTTLDLGQYVTSPLRSPAVTVLSANLSAGGPAAVTSSGSSISVTPAHDTTGVMSIAVVLTDVAGQPERDVAVTVSGQVQGHPSTPERPTLVSVGDREATISWPTPSDNGAPIQRYEVGGGSAGVVCPASPCTVTGLNNNTTYRFTVTAVNAVGSSEASPPSADARPDAVPGAVSSIRLEPGDRTLTATWDAPPSPGSPVISYQVEIQPAPSGGGLRTATGATTQFTGLQNGTSYSVRVRAQNSAGANSGFGKWSGGTPEVPFGAPSAMSAPAVTAAQLVDPEKQGITISWRTASGNGRDIVVYHVKEYAKAGSRGAALALVGTKDLSSPPPLSWTFEHKNDGSSYAYVVSATNAEGLSSPDSPLSMEKAVVGKPATIATITVTNRGADGRGYDGALSVSFSNPAPRGALLASLAYTLDRGRSSARLPGDMVDRSEHRITGLTNDRSYVIGVRGCNESDSCGDWAYAPATIPFGQPNPPTVFATPSGKTVSYRWSAGTSNGQSIRAFRVCLDGATDCQDRLLGDQSDERSYRYGDAWSISVQAIDAAGQVSDVVRSSGSIPLNPQIQVSQGGRTTAGGKCTDPSCAFIHVRLGGLAPGQTYEVSFDSNEVGDPATFPNRSFTTDANGNVDEDSKNFYGYQDRQVWAFVLGVQSDRYTWPSS